MSLRNQSQVCQIQALIEREVGVSPSWGIYPIDKHVIIDPKQVERLNMNKKTNFAPFDGLRVKTDVLPVDAGLFVMAEVKVKTVDINERRFSAYSDGRIYRHSVNSKGKRNQRGGWVKNSGSQHGYTLVGVGQKKEKIMIGFHRIMAMAFLPDYAEHLQVDHINGDKSLNCISNLRMATCRDNQRGFQTTRGVSKFRGVKLCKNPHRRKKWIATITICRKPKTVGTYHTEIEAALAFNDAATLAGYKPEALNVIR